MHQKRYELRTPEDSYKLAQGLAKALCPGDVITLQGDLGCGKTFLCREIIRYFCGADTPVPSPTFNLLQVYKAKEFYIYHYDLYRLKSAEELLELGFDEALDKNVCLIEWPEIAHGYLPKAIEITLRIEGDVRICEISFPKR